METIGRICAAIMGFALLLLALLAVGLMGYGLLTLAGVL